MESPHHFDGPDRPDSPVRDPALGPQPDRVPGPQPDRVPGPDAEPAHAPNDPATGEGGRIVPRARPFDLHVGHSALDATRPDAEGRRREPLRSADDEWRRPGLRTAAIAIAATAGVLVRVGIASGDGAFGPFAQSGRLLAGVTRADGALAHVGAVLVGLLVHALVVTAWTLVFARVAVGLGSMARWLVAIVIAALAWGVGRLVLPALLQLGYGARAISPQIVLLHVVLALSLALGMRLALEGGDEH